MYELRILEINQQYSIHLVYVDSNNNPLYYVSEPFRLTTDSYDALKDNTLMCAAAFAMPVIDASKLPTQEQYENSTHDAINLFR